MSLRSRCIKIHPISRRRHQPFARRKTVPDSRHHTQPPEAASLFIPLGSRPSTRSHSRLTRSLPPPQGSDRLSGNIHHLNHEPVCDLRFSTRHFGMDRDPGAIVAAREPQKLAALSADDMVQFLEAVSGLCDRAKLATAYGLRVDRVARLTAAAIDNRRMLIRVETSQGRQRPYGCCRGSFADTVRLLGLARSGRWHSRARTPASRSGSPRCLCHAPVRRPARMQSHNPCLVSRVLVGAISADARHV
jgi:hypothetical protein